MLRRLLLVGASIAVYAVGANRVATAQVGSPSDPICRLRATPEGAGFSGEAEYDVKAALLYRCLQLVQWPAASTGADQPTFTVGILGKNQFGESLNFLTGKSIAGRKLIITKLVRVSQASHCQLIFISSSEIKRLSRILNGVADLPVLTIGETPGFTEQGGMINLLLEGKNIRLEINPEAAAKARLVLEPQLLKMVSPAPEPNLVPNGSTGS